jgi:hypothetical protein
VRSIVPPGWRRLYVAAAYLVLALVWTWPLALHLGNRFTHDPGDPLLVTYLMWWNAHHVPLTSAWWNGGFYWPLPDALALTEHLAGLAPIATPIQLLGGSPLLAYNLVLIASVWWSGLATHAVVQRLTGNTAAAASSGIAFALAPYRTSQLGHMQLYACWWLPVMLLALHAYYEDGRLRWLLVFGIAWLLQGLTNGYFLFFFPLFLGCWLAWFTRSRADLRKAVRVCAAWMLFSIPILPFLLKYYDVLTEHGLSRSREDMLNYSAHLGSFLSATPLLRFWTTPAPTSTELYLFPGLTVVCLIVTALLIYGRNRVLTFYAAAAVLMAWMCAGPAQQPWSAGMLWHPYEWLMWIPGFGGLRVPARFFMFAALCLAIGSGLALAQILRRTRYRVAGCVIAFVGLGVDGAITGMPLGVPPGSIDVHDRGARMLVLPFADGRLSVFAMYRSMSNGLSVVNGYAGYVPSHADVIDWALNRRDPSVLTELRRGRPLYVVVASTDQAETWTRFMDAQSGAEMLGVTGGGRVYRLPSMPFRPQVTVGAATPVHSVRVDGPWLMADLGEVRTTRMIELRTHGNLVKLPAVLHVESSMDGSTWTSVLDVSPGGPALLGALAVPQMIPLRLFLPDPQARYIRINAPMYGGRSLGVFAP